MFVLGLEKCAAFARKHADARNRLARWQVAVEAATWRSLIELKQGFPQADYVGGYIVFNIGDYFRLVADVDFEAQQVLVFAVFTHPEYDHWAR